MAINYAKHRASLERLYEDKCTIYKHERVKDTTTKETKLTLVKVYDEQICKISQVGLARDGQTDAQNNINYNIKLFVGPELIIEQGHLIEVVRGATGRVEKYVSAEPFPPYPSHQEVMLLRKDWA